MFDIVELLIGLLLIIIGFVVYQLEYPRFQKLRKDQSLRKSFFTNTFVFAFASIVLGVIMVFKEVIHLIN